MSAADKIEGLAQSKEELAEKLKNMSSGVDTCKKQPTCAQCARFKVPDGGCPYFYFFTERVDGRPLMDASSTACSNFYQAYQVRKSKEGKKGSS